VPAPITGLVPSDEVDWDEGAFRAYINWALHRWVALNGGYQYVKNERDPQFSLGVSELKTQKVPLGINFFHPSGLSINAKATYYDQSGQFLAGFDPITLQDIFVSDSDKFWLCDAAISYRLPERYGMLIIGAKNLFDRSFKYYDTDELNPSIQPDRLFYAKINLSF
jgi:hypothetical protein